MKRISFYNFLLISLILVGIYSCKDMMDMHKEFIKNGEIVYLSKVDSIVSYSGNHRIQLSGYLNNAYNVNKIIVYWNDRADSMTFNYAQTKRIDSLNLIIPNLAEKSYIFDIYTVNAIGKRSIKVSIAGTAYGDFYRGNLVTRTNNGYGFDGTSYMTTKWLTADALDKGTEIRYTTVASGIVTIILPRDSSWIALPDRKAETSVTFRTVYVPELAAIDTFYAKWVTLAAPSYYEGKVSKKSWLITGYDTQEPSEGAPNGLASALIDDKLNTFWHTQWDGGSPGYPHWFSIDMGRAVSIASIEVFRRQGNDGGQTKHQFFTSVNGTDWTDYGTFAMNAKTNAGQKFISTTPPTARYIKYVALEGPNFYAFLAEINVYVGLK